MKHLNWLLSLGLLLPACGDDMSDEGGSETADTGTATDDPTSGDTPTSGGDEGDAQTPPMGHDAVQAWLAAGHYKMWKSQPGVVEPIMISPHGKQRIYINDALAGHPLDGGEYPVGTAAVKELYDDAGAMIVGYAVYLHVSAGTTGANWYWYEQVPQGHPAKPDANGVVADGTDEALCVGCHMAAGIDADHPGHDFVYSQF